MSIKNNWHDKDGNIYLIFTRKEVEELLDLSDKPVTKAFKELNETKLIYEKKQGRGKPNLVYVGKINHCILNRKKYDSRVVETPILESENVRAINNSINKNNIKKSLTNFEQRHYTNLDFLYANKIAN